MLPLLCRRNTLLVNIHHDFFMGVMAFVVLGSGMLLGEVNSIRLGARHGVFGGLPGSTILGIPLVNS